jgi:O-6-methylguanine DNA methyltransferase
MVNKALILLRKIPRGKVTTYGELARICKTSPRAIGQIMRHNKDPKLYPCYKVVRSDGSIGGYSGSIGGSKIRRKILLLKKDGIEIIKGKIDKKYFYRFSV